MRIAFGALIFLMIYTHASCAQINDKNLEYFDGAFNTVLQNWRSIIHRYLTQPERKLESAIHYRFIPMPNNFAVSYISQSGQRRIDISYGFVWSLDSLSYAYATLLESDNPVCYDGYKGYLFPALIDNSKRVQDGEQARGINDFDLYAMQMNAACKNLMNNMQPEVVLKVRRDSAAMMDANLAMILSHELAHQILRHVEHLPTKLSESRANEAQADAWAIDHSFLIKVEPGAAYTLFVFFASTSGYDAQEEAQSTHPLGLRRYYDALGMILNRASDKTFYMQKFGEPMSEEDIQIIQKLRQSIKQSLPN